MSSSLQRKPARTPSRRAARSGCLGGLSSLIRRHVPVAAPAHKRVAVGGRADWLGVVRSLVSATAGTLTPTTTAFHAVRFADSEQF